MFQFNNQLVLKLTKGCNLRCTYCYVMDKDHFQDKYIDFELFKKIIQKAIVDRKKANNKDSFNLTFHGGEPTMIDKNTFFKMCEYASAEFNKNELPINFSMQTNLTLVDEEWAKLFSRFGVSVGASWDGVDGANALRVGYDTKQSMIMDKRFYLNKNKILSKHGVGIGFLSVISNDSIKYINRTKRYLKKIFKANGAKLNYVEDVITPIDKKSDFEVPGKVFFEKIKKPEIDMFIKKGRCFDANTEQEIDKFIADYLFMEIVLSGKKGNCGIKYCGSGINVLEMEPNGEVLFCGRYGSAYEEAVIQNVLEKDFLSLNQIKKHIKFQMAKRKAMEKSHCDLCKAQSICDHGCMAYYYTKTKKWGIRNDLTCNIYKPMMDYLLLNKSGIFKAVLKQAMKHPVNIPLEFAGYSTPKIMIDKIREELNKYPEIEVRAINNTITFRRRSGKSSSDACM